MRKQLIFWIFLGVILSANEEKLVEKSKKDSPSIYAAENKEANYEKLKNIELTVYLDEEPTKSKKL